MKTTSEIRKSFLDFFSAKEHPKISSDSLVPRNDPTLLFTGAGMNQFKEYFLGLKKDMSRAASSQKCLRTGDLEEVGRTAYHHSFFEMLGNFSFGDYFKQEAIQWAWEYLTVTLGIPPERLRISVHESDDEAYKIWRDDIGIPGDRVYKMGDKSNFWPSNAPQEGPNGPCGPCSEIYYDTGQDVNAPASSLESSRFAEIWNLVFTQYDRREGGELVPLKNKNIDTGMGLERLACVLQGKKSNFEIDLFQPIHAAVKKELKLDLSAAPPEKHLYAISDHLRAIVFCVTDGVMPGNEGRGYVIRKLIRRALWHAHQIVPGERLEHAFLHKAARAVVEVMKDAYPELEEAEASVVETLRSEEERFLSTLEVGLGLLNKKLMPLKGKKGAALSGRDVFELYDTYGFPEELTRVIAESQDIRVDHAGFEEQMRLQRQRGKDTSRISESIFVSSDLEQKVLQLPKTVFLGYESLEAKATVLFADTHKNEGMVVLDRSPFYGESGGQVGDQGTLEGEGFRAVVLDARKKDDRILHVIRIEEGAVKEGVELLAKVDAGRRDRVMRNHTATHLLHTALRNILGKQVRQLGSLVSPDKLRFDYSYSEPLKPDQIRLIEEDVNREILKDTALTKEEKPLEEARREGAIAFFGEKYGDEVRVVSVGDYSKEFCGGTHCERTGQIGAFIIVSDTSVASGSRRIEALTGEGALEHLWQLRDDLKEKSVQEQELRKTLKKMKKQQAEPAVPKLKQPEIEWRQAGPVEFTSLLSDAGAVSGLRLLSDKLREQKKKGVYLLALESQEKIHYLLGMGKEAVTLGLDMREMFKTLAPFLKGSGGGRPDLVQGGARNEGQFKESWDKIIQTAVDYLKTRNP